MGSSLGQTSFLLETTSQSSNDNDESTLPFNERVLKIIRDSTVVDGSLSIRPAKLATELGISIEDADAELCGLLRAIGSTATFRFDDINVADVEGKLLPKVPKVITYTFPNDFERRANASRRKADAKDAFFQTIHALIKVTKIFVAFGLILSLAVLIVACLIAMVAAVIAVSRGGGGRNHQHVLMRHLRTMIITLRQILWCYVVFGPDVDGQDPFLRENVRALAMIFGLCCNSPTNFWFWLRVGRLRNSHAGRRWRDSLDYESPYLARNSAWRERRLDNEESEENEQKGILSIAVEFLFGPTPFSPGPSSFMRWKIRERAIVSKLLSAVRTNASVSLCELLPYSDNPPSSLDTSLASTTEALKIVVHFHGIPSEMNQDDPVSARFAFPELMLDAEGGIENDFSCDNPMPNHDFFFTSSGHEDSPIRNHTHNPPMFLKENKYQFSRLSRGQFIICLCTNVLNIVCYSTLSQSIKYGGLLEIQNQNHFVLVNHMLKFFTTYAKVFFIVPLFRMFLLLFLNYNVEKRNKRRLIISEELNAKLFG